MDVKLAVIGTGREDNLMDVKLAHTPGAQGDNVLLGQKGNKQITNKPALLVSYVYVDKFIKRHKEFAYRDLALDSGAFSAYQSGTEIKIDKYIDDIKRYREMESLKLVEVFALDVIGDWKASLKNTEKMWKAGIEAIPCYHINEPEDVLKGYARDYPKIAIGGVAKAKGTVKSAFANQCFARVWPKKIHGFGFGAKEIVMSLPFHSVDATSWEIGPCGFGRWASYGKMSIRGSKQNLTVEIEYYLNLEREANRRWHKELKLLEGLK